MSKYYNKELPLAVNVIYGGRRAGVTYREFEKLKNENKMLRDSWDDMFHKWETQVHKIGKAIEYIKGNCFLLKSGNYIDLDKDDVVELLKLLKGEE